MPHEACGDMKGLRAGLWFPLLSYDCCLSLHCLQVGKLMLKTQPLHWCQIESQRQSFG